MCTNEKGKKMASKVAAAATKKKKQTIKLYISEKFESSVVIKRVAFSLLAYIYWNKIEKNAKRDETKMKWKKMKRDRVLVCNENKRKILWITTMNVVADWTIFDLKGFLVMSKTKWFRFSYFYFLSGYSFSFSL